MLACKSTRVNPTGNMCCRLKAKSVFVKVRGVGCERTSLTCANITYGLLFVRFLVSKRGAERNSTISSVCVNETSTCWSANHRMGLRNSSGSRRTFECCL